jgi:hypothetical protein
VTFPPPTSNTSRSKHACLPARIFVNVRRVGAVTVVFSWDPHLIPQYGADADELTGAAEAAATGASPAAMTSAATNIPVLRNIPTSSPRNSYREIRYK